jgi:hypothetical protein
LAPLALTPFIRTAGSPVVVTAPHAVPFQRRMPAVPIAQASESVRASTAVSTPEETAAGTEVHVPAPAVAGTVLSNNAAAATPRTPPDLDKIMKPPQTWNPVPGKAPAALHSERPAVAVHALDVGRPASVWSTGGMRVRC